MLDAEELARRLRAARTLRGDMEQTELGALFEADGLGKTDPGRIERGVIAMQRVHLEAFCRHLRVPEAWLTDPDVNRVVGYQREGRLEDLPLEDVLDVLQQTLAVIQERLPQTGRDIGLRDLEARSDADRRTGVDRRAPEGTEGLAPPDPEERTLP